MPTLDQARQLDEFAREVFALSTDIWTAQSRAKGKHEAEISETEFLALDLLSRSESLTVGDIQRQIGVLPAQMSRVIRSLESRGDEPLIACAINRQDKRKIDVQITAAGRKAHRSYRERKLGSIQKMLLSLGNDDRAELMRILRLVRETARKQLSGS